LFLEHLKPVYVREKSQNLFAKNWGDKVPVPCKRTKKKGGIFLPAGVNVPDTGKKSVAGPSPGDSHLLEKSLHWLGDGDNQEGREYLEIE